MDSVFRAVIGYSKLGYPVLFTDSPPVPPGERRQTRVGYVPGGGKAGGGYDQNSFPVFFRKAKEILKIIKQAVP